MTDNFWIALFAFLLIFLRAAEASGPCAVQVADAAPWWWAPTLLAAALALLSGYLWFQKNAAARAAESLLERIAHLEQESAVLKSAVVPIQAAFQAYLVQKLTHYHTPRMDYLMTKLGPPVTLTPEEELELHQLLEGRTRDMNGAIPESERVAAEALPLVIKLVKAEADLLNSKLQLVAVPPSGDK